MSQSNKQFSSKQTVAKIKKPQTASMFLRSRKNQCQGEVTKAPVYKNAIESTIFESDQVQSHLQRLEDGRLEKNLKMEQISSSKSRFENKISIRDYKSLDHREEMKLIKSFINKEESIAGIKHFESKDQFVRSQKNGRLRSKILAKLSVAIPPSHLVQTSENLKNLLYD